MKDMSFGTKLKKLRRERGMSILELSLRSGIHQSTISRLENDPQRLPHIETFIHLAKGFGLSIQEFAILTEMVEPDEEDNVIIQDQLLLNNFHLLTKENILLLKELDGINKDIKKCVLTFIKEFKDIVNRNFPNQKKANA